MAKDRLRELLEKKYSPRWVRQLIADKANSLALTRREAMLAVARDLKMNWTKYATPEEIASLRGLDRGPASSTTVAAEPQISVAASSRAAPTPRRTRQPADATPRRRRSRDKVFVVHGRNGQIRSAMFTFLRDVNLNPVEWGQALKQTGKASPYISEALEAAFKDIAAVVVLVTPDDIAHLKAQFVSDHDSEEERKPMGQARPNVLFESGMAFALHPEKTVFVTFGRVKSFTDIGGMHVVRMTNAAKKRGELVDKLRTAGAEAKTDGRADWYDDTRSNFKLKEEDDADHEAP